MRDLDEKLARAREISWREHGKRLTFYTPGMFVAYGRRGRYPAVSITGGECQQGCAHCSGRLLEAMLPATSAPELAALGRKLAEKGQRGMLLSGGNDPTGRLPWERVIEAVAELSATTELIITAHAARINEDLARRLKQAGVRQALLDVVGDESTAREVLNLPDGLAAQEETIAACAAVGLELVPHIICGLHKGRIKGEYQALERVARINPQRVVYVVFMPLKGTPLQGAVPPAPQEVARIICRGRFLMPRARHHLGCARPRGRYRQELDPLAVAAGVNAVALPSDAALEEAKKLGLAIDSGDTCCSIAGL